MCVYKRKKVRVNDKTITFAAISITINTRALFHLVLSFSQRRKKKLRGSSECPFSSISLFFFGLVLLFLHHSRSLTNAARVASLSSPNLLEIFDFFQKRSAWFPMAEERGSGVTGVARRVLLISAGASHSVALLCKLAHLDFFYFISLCCGWNFNLVSFHQKNNNFFFFFWWMDFWEREIAYFAFCNVKFVRKYLWHSDCGLWNKLTNISYSVYRKMSDPCFIVASKYKQILKICSWKCCLLMG